MSCHRFPFLWAFKFPSKVTFCLTQLPRGAKVNPPTVTIYGEKDGLLEDPPGKGLTMMSLKNQSELIPQVYKGWFPVH